MKGVDPISLLNYYLELGYDVCYIDADENRRKVAKLLGDKTNLLIEDYKPHGYSTHHRDITIAVNPDLELGAYRDWIMTSYTNIYVYLPEKPR